MDGGGALMAQCNSCYAEIIWAVTESGKRIPLDAVPGSGNVALSWGRPGESPHSVTLSGPDREHADKSTLYTAHFVTCPNAEKHRNRKRSHVDKRR